MKQVKQDSHSRRRWTEILLSRQGRKIFPQRIREARKIFLQLPGPARESRYSRVQNLHCSRQIPDVLHGLLRKYLKPVIPHRINLQYLNSKAPEDNRAARKKCLRPIRQGASRFLPGSNHSRLFHSRVVLHLPSIRQVRNHM